MMPLQTLPHTDPDETPLEEKFKSAIKIIPSMIFFLFIASLPGMILFTIFPDADFSTGVIVLIMFITLLIYIALWKYSRIKLNEFIAKIKNKTR